MWWRPIQRGRGLGAAGGARSGPGGLRPGPCRRARGGRPGPDRRGGRVTGQPLRRRRAGRRGAGVRDLREHQRGGHRAHHPGDAGVLRPRRARHLDPAPSPAGPHAGHPGRLRRRRVHRAGLRGPRRGHSGVGHHRLDGPTAPFDPGQRLFDSSATGGIPHERRRPGASPRRRAAGTPPDSQPPATASIRSC